MPEVLFFLVHLVDPIQGYPEMPLVVNGDVGRLDVWEAR